ncbi:AbiU2 domain-containing protein [Nostoc sp.]|uniref:AbiU2 domain-containing protein n=1 Tax=Nostoc sp. TaxID=1180 RepID=UPI002FF53E64
MTISSVDLGKLLDTIADNLVNASIHNRLHTNLSAANEEYYAEMNQYPVFWELTINAHAIVTILMLCRVYDQHKDSLNLKKLLNIISAKRPLFEKEYFYERIKDRPFVDELSKTQRVPDDESLKRDHRVR